MESQEIEMALNTLTISPIEITIIGLISLIGVLSNIFCITVLNKKRLHIKVYTRLIHIVISVILSSTICITIDPYIMAIEVRFIFLAPLIIGLISPELIFYMTKVTTASQVLEYILSFTCIKKNTDVKLPESPVEASLVDIKETPKDDNKEIVKDSKDLQKGIAEIGFTPSKATVYKIDITTEYLKKKIEDLIQEYTIDYPLLADQEEIFKLKCMGIEAEMAEINKALMNINDLPTETAYKISETIKLYHKLVNMTTTSK